MAGKNSNDPVGEAAFVADVVISGGGPNGLMLARELSLAGIRPLVLERMAAPSAEPKANGLLGQVVQLIDRRGLYSDLSGSVEAPQPNSTYFMFGGMALDLSLLDNSPIYGLPVPQHRIVETLARRAVELGAEIRRGHEVVGLTQNDDTVDVEVAGPHGTYRVRTRYLVGADGAHSITRKLAGIEFPGVSYDRATSRAAHATVPSDWVDPVTGVLQIPGFGPVRPFLPLRTERGGFSYAPFADQSPLISAIEWDQPENEAPMSLEELQTSVRRVLGTEVPLGPPTGAGPHVLRRLSGGHTRIADRFRGRRVFLVGDAAHIYTAGGGPGLNLGLQDAANLGWKLAADIRGNAPAGLLDSYESERRQAASRMVIYAQAQSALIGPGSDITALRELFTELLHDKKTVQRLADLTAGTDIRYDMGESDAHPLVGRFAPDMELHTPSGTLRLAELTRTARPLLLDLTGTTELADSVPEWRDQIDIVTATPQPGLPTALFLRPDSYVAWASAATHLGAENRQGLRAALRRWVSSAA